MNEGAYSLEDVQRALEMCNAGAVTDVARTWPGEVEWLFLAPMPPDTKAWGVRELISRLLSALAAS